MTGMVRLIVCLSAVGLSALSCSRPREPSQPVSATGLRLAAEAYVLPKLFEVTLPKPDRWEPVTNARRFEYSPPAVLLLFSTKAPALIRFHVFDPSAVAPKEVVSQLAAQLEQIGCRRRQAAVPGKGDGAAATFDCSASDPPLRGKILAEPIPGNQQLAVLAIGIWSSDDGPGMLADFDAILGSLKAPSK
jgi:hypothetical protein